MKSKANPVQKKYAMSVNRDKPDKWKADIAQSVDMYNDWFVRFAPEAYRTTRIQTTNDVEAAFDATRNLTEIGVGLLRSNPGILPVLRMATCPPLAMDRLIGLAGVTPNLVKLMEKEQRLPPRMPAKLVTKALQRITTVILNMVDPDIIVWNERENAPSKQERYRAATIIADRLCGAVANPIIRNAQETRQLDAIEKWLIKRRYDKLPTEERGNFEHMPPGTFSFRMNVPAEQEGTGEHVNVPVDAVIMPKSATVGDLPLLVEAKSAGDFTNVNKRRKEEAAKVSQLRRLYGDSIRYALFLCGYFDSGYLGYEAAEGIDWVWEHRTNDLMQFGL